MPRELTLAALKAHGACENQRVLFRKLFGQSVLVTPELCAEHAQVFDFHWAAQHLLSVSAQVEYGRVCAPALAEFDRVRTSARVECERACAPAWAECKRVSASAQAKYERVHASAWAEYERADPHGVGLAEYRHVRTSARVECERACASAQAEYERVRASAWADAVRVCALAWVECERACASAFGRLYEMDADAA
jgi:cell division septum initiation protein DivIVA